MAKKRRKEALVAEPAAAPVVAPKPVVGPSPVRMTARDRRLVGVVLSVASVAYVNSVGGQFLYDDRFQILANPTLADLGNIPLMFTQSVWQFIHASGQEPVGAYYRPLFNVALILERHLFGTNPAGWHLVSIALHLVVTAGVYALARQWELSRNASAAAALLFALHPTHVESVAWASGVPDPIAAAALVGALLLYERYWALPRRPAWWLGASIALALAAMFTKETAIVFPAFVGLRELLDRRGDDPPAARLVRAMRRAAPFVACAVVYLGARVAVLGFLTKTEPKAVGVTTAQVVLTIPSVVLHYARILVLPYPLAITADLTYVDSAADPRFWASAVAVLVAAAAALLLAFRSPTALRALLWLALFIMPVLNLKAFNQQESLVHDRYLYIPSIGFCLLAAMAIEWAAARAARPERAFWGAVTAVCAIAFVLTVFQNETWSDDVAMTMQALAHDPDRPFLYNYMGALHFNRNELADAERCYRHAIERQPDFYDALSNLGDVCKMQNRTAEAEELYVRAGAAGAPYFNTYYNLASIYMTSRRFDEALAALERARQIDPTNADQAFSVGWCYDQKGDAARAEQAYLEALRLKPGFAEPRINLAVLQTKQGRFAEAIDNLLYAQKIAPAEPVMLYALGDVYLKTGRAQEAIAPLTQLVRSVPRHPLAYTTLGLCYETLGDAAKAKASFEQAMQVAPQEPYTQTAREHLARLGERW